MRDDRAPTQGAWFVTRLLRAPLTIKLAGANVVAALLAAFAAIELRDAIVIGESGMLPAVALLASVGCSLVLSIIALRPLRSIERAAERVWHGDYDARVPQSPLAEQRETRVGETLNLLLDGMQSDRLRMRELASKVLRAADEERAALARELHDSTAQGLAAVLYQLSALERDTAPDSDTGARVRATRLVAEEVLEEIRLLAHTLHPRVLDDLGLAAALQNLARRSSESSLVQVEVDDRLTAHRDLPPHLQSVIYRVAQESVHNALRHGSPKRIRIELTHGDTAARLEVMDDGTGFDVGEAEQRRPGMGLFTMRERLSLVHGTLHVVSVREQGTRVIATLPLDGALRADRGGDEERTFVGRKR